ncbi:helix-turn-helix domain containing protein [Microbacterium betulae]|uniref:Helix-turn-helix domain containing protein n=1 Tax=Microbacterium betulae TaxID=2981139 RepID=A0AA97FKQ8_9MICO|nr:helix-turn-helix domain-containing protein [Microbacterium sp. AB]WOF24619.1 helix-turn-helix domain containing protein [Microbacterium sp. AB]
MTPDREPDEVLLAPALTAGARRILEVASDLFYRRGIHAVGVDTIAAESGVTKRTLYDRFGSKDGLVEAYLQARHQRWWERMERRLAEHPASRVLAVWDSYTQDAESSDRGCAFINAAGELPVDHRGHRVIRAHKQAVRRRLADLIRTDHPEAGDADTAADLVFLLLEGAIAHRGIDGDDEMLRSGRDMTERLLRGGRADSPVEARRAAARPTGRPG